MVVVTFDSLDTILGGPISRGRISVFYRVGYKPYLGDENTAYPVRTDIQIVAGALTTPLNAVPTGVVCYAAITVTNDITGQSRQVNVTIPETDVDYDDLMLVDPVTFVPLSPEPATAQEVLAQAYLSLGAAVDAQASAAAAAGARDAAQAAVASVIPSTDSAMATVAADPESEFAQAQANTYGPAAIAASPELSATIDAGVVPVTLGSLKRWHAKLEATPATAKVVFLGDSTSVDSLAVEMYDMLKEYMTQAGMPLAGMSTSNIIAGGNNGSTLASWLADAAAANSQPFSGEDLIAAAPDLVVASFGLNDIRLGLTTTAVLITRLQALVAFVRTNLPNADILLRMPNSLTSTVVGTDYVDVITHQEATDRLRAAYLAMEGTSPYVVVANTQELLFGVTARATSVLMYDELHPSTAGYRLLAYVLAGIIGRQKSSTTLTSRGGRTQYTGRVSAAGNGYFQLAALESDTRGYEGREIALTAADTIVLAGYGPLALTGGTFYFSGTSLQISKTGDWTSLLGKVWHADVYHAGHGAQEGRYFATIDPGSVAAGASLDVTTTISGITREMGVVTQPPSNILASGLMWTSCISADNTVTIRLYNPTGSAIDLASSQSWRFWILR